MCPNPDLTGGAWWAEPDENPQAHDQAALDVFIFAEPEGDIAEKLRPRTAGANASSELSLEERLERERREKGMIVGSPYSPNARAVDADPMQYGDANTFLVRVVDPASESITLFNAGHRLVVLVPVNGEPG